MQANNVFNLRRMQYYLQKHATDNLRFYLMGSIAIFGLSTAIGVIAVFTHNRFSEVSNFMPFYYIGLFLGGLLFTSRSFNELGSKEKGLDFLMLPASQFEKFITLFLISTVGFFLFYHVSCYLSLKIIENVQLAITQQPIARNYQFLSDPDEKKYIYYGYFVLQSIFLLGATYFHKYSFLKTVFCVFIFLFGLYLINCILVTLLFGVQGEFWKRAMPFIMVNKLEGGPVQWHTTTYLIPHWLLDTYLFIIRFVLAPVFWTIAYFRLKDQEI
jgi:hypothetical protein